MTMFELVEAMTSYHKRSYGFGTIVGAPAGGDDMGPVIGLDASKGTSVIQAFLKRNEVFGKSEAIEHTE